MEWLAKHDYLGSEFDFIASDATGNVAYFSSAGFGPIPRQAAEAGERMYDLCEEVEELAKVSQAEELSSDSNTGEWVSAAERGFFAYDWCYERARYELVAKPRAPIRVVDLGTHQSLREFVGQCRMDIEFKSAAVVEV